ncbi:hypothetical protein J2Z21_009111 [Streptomyces griseochromogenes]|uniref:Uncharacterized protein n=1 Tax=Streptomyces griseochromogenes TaxID=68214 RepID=A0ABS4M8T9_9ACTN|nr:hypothetical protein [Streptomyces griseochromogenes]MBP2056094.1 hypothetical protein [Streptomyces griseochromogenes]
MEAEIIKQVRAAYLTDQRVRIVGKAFEEAGGTTGNVHYPDHRTSDGPPSLLLAIITSDDKAIQNNYEKEKWSFDPRTSEAYSPDDPLPKWVEGHDGPVWGSRANWVTPGDQKLHDDLRMAARYYLGDVHHFANAAAMLQHWLDNVGSDYQVDPMQILRDCPSSEYAIKVNAALAAARAKDGPFDSGWHNVEIKGQDNLDWYWALHDVQYRVSSTQTYDASGHKITTVRVQIWKRYAFGNEGDKNRTDIPTPLGGIPQSKISQLHDLGLARNYNVVGEYDEKFPSP